MPDFGTSSFTDQFLPGGSGFGVFGQSGIKGNCEAQNGGGNLLGIINGSLSTLAGVVDLLSDQGSQAAYAAFLRDGATFKLPTTGILMEVTDPSLLKGFMAAKRPLDIVANSNLGTAQTLKMFTTGARWLGVGGSVVTVVMAGSNILSEKGGTVMDYLDIGVSVVSVATPYLVTVGTLGALANPVGITIAVGVIAYSGYRTYQAFNE